jgi:hypothetical protein
MTRRELATWVASAEAVAAQAPATEDLRTAAQTAVRNNASALDKFKLDRAVEPAFQFKP